MGAWQHRFTADEVHSALLWLGGVCAEWVKVGGGGVGGGMQWKGWGAPPSSHGPLMIVGTMLREG